MSCVAVFCAMSISNHATCLHSYLVPSKNGLGNASRREERDDVIASERQGRAWKRRKIDERKEGRARRGEARDDGTMVQDVRLIICSDQRGVVTEFGRLPFVWHLKPGPKINSLSVKVAGKVAGGRN